MLLNLSQKVSLENTIWLLIFPYLLVDSLNGILVQSLNVNIPLSVLYKVFILGLVTLSILKSSILIGVFLFSILLLILLSPLSLVFTSSHLVLVHDIPLMIKYYMLMSLCVFFHQCYCRNPNKFEFLSIKFLSFNYFVVILSVLIGFIGVGYNTYPSTGLGYKGFFLAGNELSALFIVVSSFFLFKIWKNDGKIKLIVYLFHSLIVIIVGISIATKAALLSSLLIVFLIPILSERQSVIYITRLRFIYVFLGILLIFMFGYKFNDLFYDVGVLERAKYFFYRDGLLGVIFSGREEFLISFLNSLYQSDSVFYFLFGSGHSLLFEQTGRTYIEIDPIDAAMYFGFPFSIFLIVLSLLSVFIPLYHVKSSEYAPYQIVSNLLLLFFAFIAGHVWTSGLLAITWAVSLNLMFVNRKYCEKA
ncbi:MULTISPECIES: O-antigen ligase family protein [Shewanella]|uniref:O-antigen ligase family protein n=1 Tax=Shewanella TaxID=22 RepID=UPI0012FF3263|nr:O-antigen ligase family protein [Shewanella algae]MBO2640743.1 hypothetical protein [Shewanella algae]